MPSKPFLFTATAIAFLCMIATSQAQSPFSNCPNCQLKAAAAQSAPATLQTRPTTYAPLRYAAPVPMQVARPIQYTAPYSAPQVMNYQTAVVARPIQPVYSAPVYHAPVQAYRPAYRSYTPAVHSACGGY